MAAELAGMDWAPVPVWVPSDLIPSLLGMGEPDGEVDLLLLAAERPRSRRVHLRPMRTDLASHFDQ
jgi:hypothetical protein